MDPALERDTRPLESLVLAMLPTGRMIDPNTNELPDPADPRPEEQRPKLVPEHKVDEEIAGRVREILAACEVKVAADIVELGCTGLAGWAVHIDNIKLVRNGLAGSGVGLTCYVGTDRFCLAHETIGGLQDGQAQRHTEFIEKISRPLTEKERLSVSLRENARRIQTDKRLVDAADALTGRRVADDFLREVVAGAVEPGAERVLDPVPVPAGATGITGTPANLGPVPPAVPLAPGVALLTPALIRYDCAGCGATYPWPVPGLPEDMQPKQRRCTRCFALPNDAANLFKCPEHTETVWSCRYCVAAAIVNGSYGMDLTLEILPPGVHQQMTHATPIAAEAVEVEVASAGELGAVAVNLFVRVARWERKLTRT
jgi:hypothetical protein